MPQSFRDPWKAVSQTTPFLNMPAIVAATRENMLKQVQSTMRAEWRSALTNEAIQDWQDQSRGVARKEWTARKFLTANATEVSTVRQFTSALAKISPRHLEHELVWRGQANADWPIRSTLSRAVSQDDGSEVTTEDNLIEAETEILKTVRNWGLGSAELASTPLQTLAELQHAGAPTRLIDVTRSPEIGAWFATKDNPNDDGLLIAWGQHPRSRKGVHKLLSDIEVLDSGIEYPFWSGWAEGMRRDQGWGTGERTYVWFPSTPNMRMRVQRGGFLIESGPMFLEPVRDVINKNLTESTKKNHSWRLSELEQATTVVGLPSPIGQKTKPTEPALVPIFTILIKAEAKASIREHLCTLGLDTRAMYPDLPGLVTELRRNYPTS